VVSPLLAGDGVTASPKTLFDPVRLVSVARGVSGRSTDTEKANEEAIRDETIVACGSAVTVRTKGEGFGVNVPSSVFESIIASESCSNSPLFISRAESTLSPITATTEASADMVAPTVTPTVVGDRMR
jgi:hypothetical protein